ncbi:hypothetical protein [Saccharothrix coeruleofusca]|uniref:Uncharacterized protein n=1 Tax=Saccharothrix coeruleofusca TaxID=33919 RepID=A0A918AM57_9PSEU|nr:hypothetical protein [Saccharothrix coeruleofusca]MBP2336169.1 hypothetical protein [Saccharothrix coeruleofusca]GGP54919.1 hypothetical protein GCM10010185_29300 [Saccharothrix coeruleofusca]
MITGVLIAESLRTGTTLDHTRLVVQEIKRVAVRNPTADQPPVWTLLSFEAPDADADALARAFSDALDQPGWYADFRTPDETFVVFPGRIFRYSRGDRTGRTEAQAHGRSIGIPDEQLDWPV